MVAATREKSTRSEGTNVIFGVSAAVICIDHCSKFENASLSGSRDRVFLRN